MKTFLSMLDLVKSGMRLYESWKKHRPYDAYQKEMAKLTEELKKQDDKLTTEVLKELLN